MLPQYDPTVIEIWLRSHGWRLCHLHRPTDDDPACYSVWSRDNDPLSLCRMKLHMTGDREVMDRENECVVSRLNMISQPWLNQREMYEFMVKFAKTNPLDVAARGQMLADHQQMPRQSRALQSADGGVSMGCVTHVAWDALHRFCVVTGEPAIPRLSDTTGAQRDALESVLNLLQERAVEAACDGLADLLLDFWRTPAEYRESTRERLRKSRHLLLMNAILESLTRHDPDHAKGSTT